MMPFPYLTQRAGHRLEPGAGEGFQSGKVYGSGLSAGQVYGSGGGKLGMGMGLMPGEHLVPHEHMTRAIHHYKTLNGLHGHGLHPYMLPPLHAAHILHKTLEASGDNPRGGFLPAFLPVALGAAMPFISEAVKGLIGGFTKRGGENLMNRISGSGVPMPIQIGPHRHYKVHGEGFKDIISAALGHLTRILKSEPARKLGSHAISTLHEAFQHAIVKKMESLFSKLQDKISGKAAEPIAEAKERQPDAPSEDDEFFEAEENPAGSGMPRPGMKVVGCGRKRKAPAKKRAPRKKTRVVHHRRGAHHRNHVSSYYPVY